MGSFDFTCGISNLPIGYGDEVRYFLLSENRCSDSDLYVDSRYAIRTPPIKAKYDSYATVEEFDENHITTKVMFQGLDQDVVEQPLGENQYHDCPVTKGMSIGDWLNAFREERVKVRPTIDWGKQSTYYTIPKGVPTIARIRKLCAGTEDLYFSYLPKSYQVRGEVSLSSISASNLEKLSNKYKVTKKEHHYTVESKDPNVIYPSRKGTSSVQVVPMMVREDVYQAVLAYKFSELDFDVQYKDKFEESVNNLIKAVQKPDEEFNKYLEKAA